MQDGDRIDGEQWDERLNHIDEQELHLLFNQANQGMDWPTNLLGLDVDQRSHLPPHPAWSDLVHFFGRNNGTIHQSTSPNNPPWDTSVYGSVAQTSVGSSYYPTINAIETSASSSFPLPHSAPEVRNTASPEAVLYMQQTFNLLPINSSLETSQQCPAPGYESFYGNTSLSHSLSTESLPTLSSSQHHSPNTSIGTSSLPVTPGTPYPHVQLWACMDTPASIPKPIPSQPASLEVTSFVRPAAISSGYPGYSKKRKVDEVLAVVPSISRTRRRISYTQEELKRPKERPFPIQPINLPHLLNSLPSITPQPILPPSSVCSRTEPLVPSDEEDRPAAVVPAIPHRAEQPDVVEETQSSPGPEPQSQTHGMIVCHIKRVGGGICGEVLTAVSSVIRTHFNEKHVNNKNFIWPKTISECPFPVLKGKSPCRSTSEKQMLMSCFMKHLIEQHILEFTGVKCPGCHKVYTRAWSMKRHDCTAQEVETTSPDGQLETPPG